MFRMQGTQGGRLVLGSVIGNVLVPRAKVELEGRAQKEEGT